MDKQTLVLIPTFTYVVNFCSKSGLWKFKSPIFPLQYKNSPPITRFSFHLVFLNPKKNALKEECLYKGSMMLCSISKLFWVRYEKSCKMLKNDTYSNSVSSLPKKYEQSVYIINKRAFFGNDILLYSRYKQKQTYIHSCKSMLSLLSILSDKKLCIISLTKRV